MTAAALKNCRKCGTERPIEDFAHDASKASGRKSICRPCDNAKSRRYYEANHGAVLVRVVERNAEVRAAKPARRCAACGQPATSQKHWFCDECRARGARRKRKRNSPNPPLAKTSARGYGTHHQNLRARWATQIKTGGVSCARCGRPIVPGMLWDLGHHDTDRRFYVGPEHRRCNRGAAAHKVNAMKRARRVRRLSRQW